MAGLLRRLNLERVTGLLIVLAMHGAVLYGLWSARLIPTPEQAVTLFVDFINPAPPPREPEAVPKPAVSVKLDRPRPPAPRQPEMPQQFVAEAPVMSPAEPVATPSPPASPMITAAAPPAPVSEPAAPLNLASELSVSCPVRHPPAYPMMARRIGEEGYVVLRVKLDDQGKITAARVAISSGSSRLDGAALAAVKSWQCNAAQRDGQPVPAVAMQPFNFTLEGR